MCATCGGPKRRCALLSGMTVDDLAFRTASRAERTGLGVRHATPARTSADLSRAEGPCLSPHASEGEAAEVTHVVRRTLRSRPGWRTNRRGHSCEPVNPDFPDDSLVSAWHLRLFPANPRVSDDFLIVTNLPLILLQGERTSFSRVFRGFRRCEPYQRPVFRALCAPPQTADPKCARPGSSSRPRMLCQNSSIFPGHHTPEDRCR
jgi:hypothetical protein